MDLPFRKAARKSQEGGSLEPHPSAVPSCVHGAGGYAGAPHARVARRPNAAIGRGRSVGKRGMICGASARGRASPSFLPPSRPALAFSTPISALWEAISCQSDHRPRPSSSCHAPPRAVREPTTSSSSALPKDRILGKPWLDREVNYHC